MLLVTRSSQVTPAADAGVGVWTAEALTAEDDASSDVDVPYLDYKKD